ncbi:hypothetical protein [Ornithinibacillus californiensis]|uniref:hypothetical protein n=1 Tax=Ornithinibacillus californiensis TaxID=161536 RepID=UPI00064E02B2|nr:hypothetical protein [Ornithinibacillus californiensis]
MIWGIVFFILNVALIFYVIYSLSAIKYQLKLISKYLDIKDDEEVEKISNEEIEKELEHNFK